MKTGITSSVTQRHYDVFEGLEKLAECGFDCADFALNTYTLKNFPEGSVHRVMYTDKWRDFILRVRECGEKCGIGFYQAHALWGLYSDMKEYIPPEEQYFRQIEASALLGAENLVFHPIPPTFRVESNEKKAEIMDYNLRWFGELIPCAEEYGVSIALENTFTHVENRPGDGLFPFATGESMRSLAEGLDSEMAVICLDTGHANVEYGKDLPSIVGEMGEKLRVLHVHDNFGQKEPLLSSDLHMFPGYGNSDIEGARRELGRHGYRGVLSLEPSHLNMPKERLDIALRSASEMARYYAGIVESSRGQS
jgi:sugar phosphate isomerase/epimerase